MKKVAVTVAVLALGLAACEGQTDDPAIANEAAVEEEAVTDVNYATDMGNDVGVAADNALDNATEALENASESISNAEEAIENAAE